MKYGESIMKDRHCPYMNSWINLGWYSCEKGKRALTDCKNCEYMQESEVKLTYANI